MNPASALRKKAVGGDAFRRKDKDKERGQGLRTSPGSIHQPTATVRSRAPGNFPMPAGPVTLDIHRFADENWQAEDYVSRTLASANEEVIRGFHKSLVEAKHVVGGDLQRNVYRNYTEFVTISKEVSNLDSDVLHLKNYLNELRSIWEGFAATANASDEMVPANTMDLNKSILPHRKRSDFMPTDMQSIYRAQIMDLWENVAGSQRFVSYTPDRHIIRECINFVELDPQTLRPLQAVHLILLNDCLLVASQKKRSMSNKYKLVAENCYSLQDMAIIDIKDSPELNNAFKVVVYPKTILYRSERPEDKHGLMHAYHLVMDSNEDQQQEFLSSGPQDTSPKQDARKPADYNLSAADQRWLTSLPDELEVMIALREFEEAVGCIERARAVLSECHKDAPFLRDTQAGVKKYTDSLCTLICHDLSNTLLTKLQFQRYVGWLLRLDKGKQAREVFLATRSLIIKKRIRQLVFEGDITTYIGELALVVFTLIRNTCEWYRDSFKQNEMASGFVTWIREQTEIYAEIYKRQVFSNSQLNCQLIAHCFKSTLDQCGILRKVGLDLKFLLEDLFLEDVKSTIIAYENKNTDKVEKFAKSDNFMIVSNQNLDICLIAKLQLYDTVVGSISRLTEFYLQTMLSESKNRGSGKEQRSIALTNVSFVLDNIIPKVSSELNYHFDRPIPELDSLRARLRGHITNPNNAYHA
ncbi:exocyst complex component exo84 [Apophysomyces ossiformis]|uniref:Exocyst complex component EXO84 n=1 Tax=Apophysomyces ossiformis TaxID=679940 RepID=A0A8H7BXQ5_9FUNG|nr:exocyst complex component exo84 [Apophysomyces ossiformis]